MSSHAWYAWPFWLLLAALVPWALFVAFYASVGWWRHPIGRSLMLSKVVIVGVLVNSIVGWFFPGHHFRTVMFVVLVGGSCLAGFYQLTNLLREQRRARRAPECPRRRATDRIHRGEP